MKRGPKANRKTSALRWMRNLNRPAGMILGGQVLLPSPQQSCPGRSLHKSCGSRIYIGQAGNALTRMPKTGPHLDNGFLELDNNTVERAVKPVAIGRKNWMFAGSQRGGAAMAIAFTLIETAKLNGVDPQA